MATSVQWLGDAEAKPAPGPLRRVQGLINTIDRESGEDRLSNADDAGPWLIANGLLTPGDTPDADELSTLRDAREGLRALVIHNAGGPVPDPARVAPLRAVAADVAVQATIEAHGTVTLTPIGDSLRARLLGLLLVVQDSQREGTWAQLKACANDDCLWAFYDRSRNHGGTWCDMATCGNKLKNRDFRARQRSQQ
jgi:predicted RNA-binding Zn ribbon-like protein